MSSDSIEFSKQLNVTKTPIPDLLLFDLPVHGDSRGWFKENWQRAKMNQLGLPELGPVQNNVSFNAQRGVTRGIHAEPWDKYISIGSGKIFGAWVDLREGETFGAVFTAVLDPSKAIFVPRGVGNAFQALEDNTVYMYLVNDHWSMESQNLYTFLNLTDETAAIDWPIPLDKAELSEKDKAHPALKDVVPMKPRNILVTGADSKLGKALRRALPNAEFVTADDFDATSDNIGELRNWRQYDTIINAAAYMNVDGAETAHGRETAWQENVRATTNLTRIASEHLLTLIHLSSDYIFDGTESSYDESSFPSPINSYGQTIAAADAVISATPKHYIIRTGWLVGEGRNFVDTMLEYASEGLSPRVVDDQIGRLTFADDLASFIAFIVQRIQKNTPIEYGTYNYTGDGAPASWADVAAKIYELAGRNPLDVTRISSREYADENPDSAQRPSSNVLQLDRVRLLGVTPPDWQERLEKYIHDKPKKKGS